MKEEKVAEKRNGWVKWIVLASVVIILFILSYLLFNLKEAYVKDGSDGISRIDSVYCTGKKIEDSFFNTKQDAEIENTIKITFKDGKPDKMSYDFDGAFESELAAEAAEAELHAKYNTYLGGKGISPSSLSPVFSVADNNVKISLFTDIKRLVNTTIQLFFLDMGNFQKIRSYSPDDYKKLYESKGFSCTILK